MDTVNLVTGLVSIIIAFVAFAQATYFYVKGKDTERRVSDALSAIQAQVNTLQALNAVTIERLTK